MGVIKTSESMRSVTLELFLYIWPFLNTTGGDLLSIKAMSIAWVLYRACGLECIYHIYIVQECIYDIYIVPEIHCYAFLIVLI